MDNGLPPRDSNQAEDKQAIERGSHRVAAGRLVDPANCRVAGRREVARVDKAFLGKGKRVIERDNCLVGDRPAIGLAVVLAGDRRKAISIGS